MTKLQMINRLADVLDISRKKAEGALNLIVSSVLTDLTTEGHAKLYGVGTFSIKYCAPRTGRNPCTGEAVAVPARCRVKFKMTRSLRNTINYQGR